MSDFSLTKFPAWFLIEWLFCKTSKPTSLFSFSLEVDFTITRILWLLGWCKCVRMCFSMLSFIVLYLNIILLFSTPKFVLLDQCIVVASVNHNLKF